MPIRYIHLDSVDSTNTWAKHHVVARDEIICVVARNQTGGRGQGNKQWLSPPDVNIYASLCFSLPRECPHLADISLLIARSLVVILKKRGFSPQIKWPNDILLDGKKVAGILTEATTSATHIDVIVGIGINVNMSADQLSLIDQPATSLCLESPHQRPLPCQPLLEEIVSQCVQDLHQARLLLKI